MSADLIARMANLIEAHRRMQTPPRQTAEAVLRLVDAVRGEAARKDR